MALRLSSFCTDFQAPNRGCKCDNKHEKNKTYFYQDFTLPPCVASRDQRPSSLWPTREPDCASIRSPSLRVVLREFIPAKRLLITISKAPYSAGRRLFRGKSNTFGRFSSSAGCLREAPGSSAYKIQAFAGKTDPANPAFCLNVQYCQARQKLVYLPARHSFGIPSQQLDSRSASPATLSDAAWLSLMGVWA